MPRTFSRGEKVTAEFLNRMQQYLSVDEGDIWVRRMRFLYCPEEGLIEQDLEPFFEKFLPDNLRRLMDLTNSLEGGGIIPASMRQIIRETESEAASLLREIQNLRTPIIEV